MQSQCNDVNFNSNFEYELCKYFRKRESAIKSRRECIKALQNECVWLKTSTCYKSLDLESLGSFKGLSYISTHVMCSLKI